MPFPYPTPPSSRPVCPCMLNSVEIAYLALFNGRARMKSPGNKQFGIVAILDALGAASYSDAEIETFLKSRENALKLLDLKIEGFLGEIKRFQVDIFTFNDTILIVLKTGQNMPSLKQLSAFFAILRKFLVDSLTNRILFRGSVAVGSFYTDNDTNTVMGQAVTDAAAWYDKAEWIGIHATPKTAIFIQQHLEQSTSGNKTHLMLDYPVPIKGGGVLKVKAVNWPKVFFVDGLTPCDKGHERKTLLSYLSAHPVPRGTEEKYFNSIQFFDDSVKDMKKEQAAKKKRPKT